VKSKLHLNIGYMLNCKKDWRIIKITQRKLYLRNIVICTDEKKTVRSKSVMSTETLR